MCGIYGNVLYLKIWYSIVYNILLTTQILQSIVVTSHKFGDFNLGTLV